MSRRSSIKPRGLASRLSAEVGKSERSPLLDSSALSESIVNKGGTELQTGVSWGVAAFLLVNTALGAGMLNYPYAYNQVGGVFAATLMQVVLLLFISSTMFILVYCADLNRDDTYHDVLLTMCGKRAQQISALSILLTCYGINVTFLVIIGDQYDRMFNSLLPDHFGEWYLDRKFTIFVTSVLFIWPMCYAKRLDFLRHASILGMFAMLYVAFLTVYEHYVLDEATIARIVNNHELEAAAANHTGHNSQHQHKSLLWFEPIAIIPVLCFAYQTHEVIVPVYACMRERCITHFMNASVFGLVILFFLYNIVGAYGYLTFGKDVGPDIMSLYDGKDPVVVIGIIALVVKFITTYPPLMFCGRSALDGLYGEFRKLSTDEFKASERTRRVVITTFWFFSTVALAAFAPDISVTLQLLGSMASINVFVFPGMCLFSLTRRLRQARIALLQDESLDLTHQQRAKDYYLISGSYYSTLKKKEARHASLSSQALTSGHGSGLNQNRQQYTATFASLIEFENNTSDQFVSGHSNDTRHARSNGYGTTQTRQQRRQDEFNRILTNGNISSEDGHGQVGRLGNDSHEDSSDSDGAKRGGMLINPMIMTASNGYQCTANRMVHDSEFDRSSNCKDLSLDKSAGFTNNLRSQSQLHQTSWNNSLLNRLGSSIAPSTVAQIGISRCAAIALYIFGAILIMFGAFTFVLELVSVLGLL